MITSSTPTTIGCRKPYSRMLAASLSTAPGAPLPGIFRIWFRAVYRPDLNNHVSSLLPFKRHTPHPKLAAFSGRGPHGQRVGPRSNGRPPTPGPHAPPLWGAAALDCCHLVNSSCRFQSSTEKMSRRTAAPRCAYSLWTRRISVGSCVGKLALPDKRCSCGMNRLGGNCRECRVVSGEESGLGIESHSEIFFSPA